jgi:hypothetical protein
LTWSIRDPELKRLVESSLPIFTENHRHHVSHQSEADPDPPGTAIRGYLLKLKRSMKLLTTQIVQLEMSDRASVMEKGFSLKKRKQGKGRRQQHLKKTKDGDCATDTNGGDGRNPSNNNNINNNNADVDVGGANDNNTIEESGVLVQERHPATSSGILVRAEEKQLRILRRKRFHNFTENLMAHEYLACRRLDRLYHRATLRFSPRGDILSETDDDGDKRKVDPTDRTSFIVLSMNGDMFLKGQAVRIIGVFLAIANGVIDPAFADCVFDERYPHLVPTPPAPIVGMVAGDAHYMTQEGKTKSILSPRVADRYSRGWNQESTLYRVKDWQEVVYAHMVRKWKTDCRDPTTGRLRMEQEWTEGILLPWAVKANRHLEEYQRWSRSCDQEPGLIAGDDVDVVNCTNAPVPEELGVTSTEALVDPTVPAAYVNVLRCLRALDTSGRWPTTTPKRQLVMISTGEGQEAKDLQADSLSMAFIHAKNNRRGLLSAYSYAEGQGGASGSFSVGLMPGGVNKQPKANSLFPDLVKAAFELELELCPEREPSSTIAINRNAQFRPHTDSGAGAGQSTSLIVGLGTYSGGELMVEGEKHDIRYKAIQFNGWKQRHWTMPFKGERYSLVWFTPKGCEGMRGIDLELEPGGDDNDSDDSSTE